jgi:serine/threonine-protein kinase RsbT
MMRSELFTSSGITSSMERAFSNRTAHGVDDGTANNAAIAAASSSLNARANASSELVQTMPLSSDEHVVAVRKAARDMAIEIKLSLVDQTKLVTAASELARNTIKYGGGGVAHIHLLNDGSRSGVQISFVDQGPGIADVELALQDGFTSGGGLGLGLGGSKRLVDEFEIVTAPGQGTAITIGKWKR